MKTLRNQERPLHAEDGVGPVAGIVGAAAGVVAHHVGRRHTAGHGIVVHAPRLVVIHEAVVAADQQLAHFAGVIKRDGRVHPVGQHRAEPAVGANAHAEDDRDRRFGHGVDVRQHQPVIAPLDPTPGGRSSGRTKQHHGQPDLEDALHGHVYGCTLGLAAEFDTTLVPMI